MTCVGILHPGAMGAAVGAALMDAGHEIVWASAGRSEATAERAAALRDVGTVDALLAASDVVLSVCPPAAAVDVARQAAGFDGLYVDANAIAPATAAEIAALVGDGFVDGGIIGPPPHKPGTTRLYLSGARAEEVAEVFDGGRVSARVVSNASALKMVYAAWTKGSAALLLAIEQTATANGVDEDLRAEWALSQPALADRLDAAHTSARGKGWRWAAEMREIAATFAAAGQPNGFHEAAAQVYDDTAS
jgi:3-hydroxyisobutyrate dehydrogenase-like beta-hydroxyacid dehydrogenase